MHIHGIFTAYIPIESFFLCGVVSGWVNWVRAHLHSVLSLFFIVRLCRIKLFSYPFVDWLVAELMLGGCGCSLGAYIDLPISNTLAVLLTLLPPIGHCVNLSSAVAGLFRPCSFLCMTGRWEPGNIPRYGLDEGFLTMYVYGLDNYRHLPDRKVEPNNVSAIPKSRQVLDPDSTTFKC